MIDKRFQTIYIEISNICNLQCTFCPVVERDKKVMSVDDFQNVLEQAAPMTEKVCLHLMGEPLAHPDFEKIHSLCVKAKIPIQITTNGILIERYQDLILSSPIIRQINFSIHSFKDNFPNRPLSEYVSPIFSFSKNASKQKPELYINYRLWNLKSDAQNDNDEFIEACEKAFDISVKRTFEIGAIKSKKIWNRVYLHFDTRFEWPSPALQMLGEKGSCHGMRKQIGIHADGTVVPCCLDKEARINLGNCLDDELESIINSERALSMIKGFDQGVFVEDLCKRCSFARRFKS